MPNNRAEQIAAHVADPGVAVREHLNSIKGKPRLADKVTRMNWIHTAL